jgi:hypothetical protein
MLQRLYPGGFDRKKGEITRSEREVLGDSKHVMLKTRSSCKITFFSNLVLVLLGTIQELHGEHQY